MVARIFTTLAIVEVRPQGLVASALIEGASLADVQAVTGAPLAAADRIATIRPDGSVVP